MYYRKSKRVFITDLSLSEENSHLGTFVRGGSKHPIPLVYYFKGTIRQGEGQMLNKGWKRRITNICKSCYLHIKCFPANSLAALMWRWCLNSKTSSLTVGGRRFKEVWDGTRRSSHNLIYTCTREKVRKWWYITWKGVQRKETEKKREKKESLRNKIQKGKSPDTWESILAKPRASFISYSSSYSSKPSIIVTSCLNSG